jgi:6-pyruvoyltetrahydropterin/6-carboxytetrahydropterin synthase
MLYKSTKTYTHNAGFSCCFRQWRADSHCRFLHGYALQFKMVFASQELDTRNWVVDFGALKPVKKWLEEMFDHTTLVAKDDPEIDFYRQMVGRGLVQLREVESTGCEATAKMVFNYVELWLHSRYAGRVWLESVEVSEHEGNSALVVRNGN